MTLMTEFNFAKLTTDSQFGDSHAIIARRMFLTRVSLGAVPAVGPDMPYWPEDFLGDPLVRMVAGRDAGQYEPIAVRDVHRRLDATNGVDAPGETSSEIGGRRIPIITDDRSSLWEPVSQRWRAVFTDEDRTELSTVGKAESAVIRAAVERLSKRAPTLVETVLPHVRAIAVFKHPRSVGSCTAFSLPGVVLMNQSLLQDPEKLLDLFYHESVHCKYYDIMSTTQLLAPNADDQYVYPPWHTDKSRERDRAWLISRAVGAMHVYTHYEALDLTTDSNAASWRGSARERAEILGRLLSESSGLTRRGQEFVRWNLSLLGAPSSGSEPAVAPGQPAGIEPDRMPLGEIRGRIGDPTLRVYSLPAHDYHLAESGANHLRRIDTGSYRLLKWLTIEKQATADAVVIPPNMHRTARALAAAGLLDLSE